MGLQSINIDKYIGWYRDLSEKIEYVKNNDWKIDYYTVLSYEIFVRGLKNKDSKLNALWEKAADNRVKEILTAKEAVKQYLNEIWFIPTLIDWAVFDKLITLFSDSLKEFINTKLKQSAKPDRDILQDELNRINEKEQPFREYAMGGIPVLKIEIDKNIFSKWSIGFADFVSDCYFAKWLQNRLNELGKAKEANLTKIKMIWGGDKWQLSELIKALSLTALNGYSQTEIIKMFEQIFEDKHGQPLQLAKRHNINLNELQYKQTNETFTKVLYQAFNNFISDKLQ